MKSSETLAMAALERSRNPTLIKPTDFFAETKLVRAEFSKIVGTKPKHIAIVPSTSYGFSCLFTNIQGKPGGKAITVSSEFPSGFFALKKWCARHNQSLQIVPEDDEKEIQGPDWNERLIAAIDENTSVVCMSAIHWSTGYKYALEAIGHKCRQVGAKFLIDGAQTIGALPVDVKSCHIDGLVCASYKCLHGAYSLSLLYVDEYFFDKEPIEEAWMNRHESENFSALSKYNMDYQDGAHRFNVGQTSNFITMPILLNGLQKINEWTVEAVQLYCKELAVPFIDKMENLGYAFEKDAELCYHLFSIKVGLDKVDQLSKILVKRNLSLSMRAAFLRISLSVYNTPEDLDMLAEALTELKNHFGAT
jgi:selenocysteine lyase/cysteine desulfurase